MMGLKDGTYYLAWIIFNISIVLIISIIVTVIEFLVFKKSNFVLFFAMNFFFGLSFMGSIFFCSAVLPSARKAGMAVIFINIFFV